MAQGGPDIDLARALQLEARILVSLLPVGDPTGKASQREHDGEHVLGNAHGAQDDAAVEVDVRIEIAGDEKLVPQRQILHLERDIHERILDVQRLEDAVAGLLDDRRARVVVLVDAVTEAVEQILALGVLDLLDALPRRDTARHHLLEHLDGHLVGTAVQRPPERADAGRDGGVEIHSRAADQPHGGRRAVLLVVGMQDQEHAERLDNHRINLVRMHRRVEHHVQEVGAIAQIVPRVDKGLADRLLVGEGRDRAQFREQACRRDVDRLLALIAPVLREFGVEGRERDHHGRENRHRVGAVGKAVEEVAHVLVEHRVTVQQQRPFLALLRIRHLAVDQQVGHLDKARLGGQFLDRITAVAQNALLAIQIGDGAGARAGVLVAVVKRHGPGLLAQGRDIDGLLAFAALEDGQGVVLVPKGQGGGTLGGHEGTGFFHGWDFRVRIASCRLANRVSRLVSGTHEKASRSSPPRTIVPVWYSASRRCRTVSASTPTGFTHMK